MGDPVIDRTMAVRIATQLGWEPKREWINLTDAEIEGAIDEGFAFGLDDGNVSNKIVIRYVRVIEAMLKEKNNASS